MALASRNKDCHRHLLGISRTPVFERKVGAATRLINPTSLKGSPDSKRCSRIQRPKKMSRHEGDWTQTTARVLSHLRMLSRIGEPNITAQDKAAIDRVWAFVGVRIIEEYDSKGHWKKVAPARREGVRQRLLDGLRDAFRALDPDGTDGLGRTDVARTAFRDKRALRRFRRAHLLDWGNRLLAAEAANVAPPPPPPPPPPYCY